MYDEYLWNICKIYNLWNFHLIIYTHTHPSTHTGNFILPLFYWYTSIVYDQSNYRLLLQNRVFVVISGKWNKSPFEFHFCRRVQKDIKIYKNPQIILLSNLKIEIYLATNICYLLPQHPSSSWLHIFIDIPWLRTI